MELPTGFVETESNGFSIITRPAYFRMALAIAERDPEKLLAAEATHRAIGPMQGRGVRAELPGEGGETIILKRQLRGGLYRRVMGDVFKSNYHSVSDIFISETAWKKGVPVALLAFAMSAPAGEGRLAAYRRAYVGSIKLEGTRSLMEWLSSPITETERHAVLAAAASAISRAHDRGFKHGDLNLGNVLVAVSELGGHSAWLIDLQHSELGGALKLNARLDNLVRLYRSAEKWLPEQHARRRLRDIAIFLRAYTNREPGEVRRYLAAAAKRRPSLLLHRLGWRATGAGRVRPRSSAPSAR